MTPLLLVAAAAKDPPIIDLDSTVLLQLAIFIITMIVLSRVLFRPYLKVKTQRVEGMEGAREAARRMDEEAQARIAQYGQAFNQAKQKANQERGKLQSEAVGREHEILAAARTTTGEMQDKARKRLEQDTAAARKELTPRAQDIARDIAKKILGREVA